jgi:hypothetical protein
MRYEFSYNMAFKIFFSRTFNFFQVSDRNCITPSKTLPRNIFDIMFTAGAIMQSIRCLNRTASRRRPSNVPCRIFFPTAFCVTTNGDETRISPYKFLRVRNLVSRCEVRTQIEYKLCGVRSAVCYV